MSISAIAATAQHGVQQALDRFDRSAQRTVRDANGGKGDLVSDVADQIGAKEAAEAGLRLTKVADDMLGSLFDIKV